MSTLKVEEALKIRSDVVVTVLEEGAVLLDLETKYFYSTNSTGWAILQILESGATKDEVLTKCIRWGATQSDNESIHHFLEVLASENLVSSSNKVARKDVALDGGWKTPVLEKHKEPLQRIMTNAFDPSIPLAE